MSSEFMRKTANVLEKLAEHLDQEETRYQAGIREERLKTAQALGEKIATVTGEEIPQTVLERIAASDQDILDTFSKLAERSPRLSGAPEEPGDVGEIRDNNVASYSKDELVKEAAETADNRFLDWVMS